MAPITTLAELSSYLASAGIGYTSIQPLSGGTANFVWRLQTSDGRTLIVKHAEPYIASIPSIPFPVDRMDFEARALEQIPRLLGRVETEVPVRVVRLVRYDAGAKVLVMEDGGEKTLKESYTDPTLPIPQLGATLSKWLAKLHASTATTDATVGDNQTAKFIYRHSYNGLADALERFGFDRTIGERVNENYGSLLQTDDECICHGDFWPGNVLLRRADNAPPTLALVDWEMTRRGTGATDVGQFAAEAWLLDRFRGQRGLASAFLRSYVDAAKPSKEFLRRVVVHFGTHIAFWPTSVVWGSEEETREVVGIGKGVLEGALEGEWALDEAGLGIGEWSL
ncbi:hypothetical protein H2201_005393 [Coniosporium apollinis]|uniref:Aminoglycoside phosphotransferase domain-containing protein n=1 Tax=Coniosporium apollinis TaxID=61459 RepID=A0ABQ9NT91_9PEZI|nr:hypothetical protein H2201_005393 [Coniosporium apollinis]